MSDFFDDEYDDEPTPQVAPSSGGGPKALREAYDAQKARADALEERLAKIETANRKAQLATALKGTGVTNPDALGDFANLIDPDKAGDFMSAMKAAMGLDAGEQAQGVPAEDVAAIAAVSGEPGGGTSTPTTTPSLDALNSINDEADFWKAIRG